MQDASRAKVAYSPEVSKGEEAEYYTCQILNGTFLNLLTLEIESEVSPTTTRGSRAAKEAERGPLDRESSAKKRQEGIWGPKSSGRLDKPANR